MARTSAPWRLLPAGEFGCGSATTVWRRLDEWTKAGVFDAPHLEVLDRLGLAGRLDWSRASADMIGMRAKRGGAGRRKSSRPRQARLQAPPGHRRPRLPAGGRANGGQRQRRHDVRGVVGRPAVLTPSGRRRCRPEKVHANKGYGARHCRAYLRRRRIRGRIARRGIESSERLGQQRWPVERSPVVAELLPATGDPLGPGRRAILCVGAASVRAGLLQSALAVLLGHIEPPFQLPEPILLLLIQLLASDQPPGPDWLSSWHRQCLSERVDGGESKAQPDGDGVPAAGSQSSARLWARGHLRLSTGPRWPGALTPAGRA
jgi:hypothetical protein